MIKGNKEKDKDGNRAGEEIILDELAIQLFEQKEILGEPPLTLSIGEILLDLSEKGIFPALCLGEIILVNFVRFQMLNADIFERLKEYNDFITDVCSRLPSGVKRTDIEWMIKELSTNTLPLYRKVIIIRHALKNQGENVAVQVPTTQYIGNCERIARNILGDELFNAHVEPIVMNASRLLGTLPYFEYNQKVYTLLVNELYDAFLAFVVKPYMGIRRTNKQPLIRSEVNREFPWLTLIAIMDRFGQPIIRDMEIETYPRYITQPLSNPVLAELASCEILWHIGTPRRAWHNCHYQKSKDSYTFLGCSPPGVADAGANYDDKHGRRFSVTIEVSIAGDKSKIVRKRQNNRSILGGLHEDKGKTTTGYNDLLAALDHGFAAARFEDNPKRKSEYTAYRVKQIEKADEPVFIAAEIEKYSKKNENDLTDSERALYSCNPKFSFILHKEFPPDRNSVELILAAAAHKGEPTLIPITFRQMALFMNALTALFKKDPHEITQKQWFAILRGIEKELDLLYGKYQDKDKRTNADKAMIENLKGGKVEYLISYLFSEEKLNLYCKGKTPSTKKKKDKEIDKNSSGDEASDGHEENGNEDLDGNETDWADDNGEHG